MNFFPLFFFVNCIPFEVNVASGFQANGREAVIVWFTGLRAIEILLPLLICTRMSLPCSHSPVSPAVTEVMSCVSIRALQLSRGSDCALWVKPCVAFPPVNSSRPCC